MFFVAAILAASAVPPPSWKTYTNVRYRYRICFPAELIPQGEAPNSDGQTFEARDGARLAVFGRNDVEHTGISKSADEDADFFARDAGRVTYRAAGKDWAVRSGSTATRIFYVKLLKRSDQLLFAELSYPVASAARYNSIAATMARCFKAL